MGRTTGIVLVTTLAVAVAVLAIRPSTASSSSAGDPRIAVLQKQVRALQGQPKSLHVRLAIQSDESSIDADA